MNGTKYWNYLLLILAMLFTANVTADRQNEFLFPLNIGQYQYVKRHYYKNPSLGYSLVYMSNQRAVISIIVYNMGISNIKTGINDRRTKNQFKKAKGDIKTAIAYGYYLAVDQITTPKEFPNKYLSASYLITLKDGLKKRSHLFLRGQNGLFIKIRATGPNSPALDKSVAEFVKRIASILQVGTKI